MPTQLTPNVDVPSVEIMLAAMTSMAYAQYLRPLVIEKIDDPGHIWDDRALKAMDGVFDYAG